MGVWCILIMGNNLHGSETAPACSRLCDSCRQEVARRLRQDAAVKGGIRLEINLGLGQNDALHVRTCVHLDLARDLPENVLRLSSTYQIDSIACHLFEVPRHLNDEHVSAGALEVDVTSEIKVCAKSVDAGG